MKVYELSILIHPDLEMNLDPVLDKVKKLLEANGGKIVKEEADGKKRMSYTIKGQDYAVYHFYSVELPPEAPGKISAVLNITDEILRHLLVSEDERKAKLAARRAAKATSAEPNDGAKEEEA